MLRLHRARLRRLFPVAIATALAIGLASSAAHGVLTRSEPLPAHARGIYAFAAPDTSLNPAGFVQEQLPRFAELPRRPALIFPAGIGYRTAVRQYYEARQRGMELPAGAALGEQLPPGKVLQRLADGRLALDPAAPLGYDLASGRVTEPTYTLPGHLTPQELDALFAEARRNGWVLPRGAELIAGTLPRCQVVLEDAMPNPACGAPGARIDRVDLQ